MRKVLLVGVLNETVRSLEQCMLDDFNVQLCSEQLENFQAMAKISRPDLLIIVQEGMEDHGKSLFEWLQVNCTRIPRLVITTKEIWEESGEICKGGEWDVMFRPTVKTVLLENCYRLLHMESMANKEEKKAPEKAPEKKKVMIVDDSALLLRNMKTMLEKDYKVSLAKSGEQALEMIPAEKPDLILLDYEMDGMSGKSMFEEMKKDKEMQDIPVVFLTSIANKDTVHSVLQTKPEGYILKPPDEKKIIGIIEEIFSRDAE